MKEFSCGDVVPGCTASFRAACEGELLEQVAAHARQGHGLMELTEALVSAVRQHIRSANDG